MDELIKATIINARILVKYSENYPADNQQLSKYLKEKG